MMLGRDTLYYLYIKYEDQFGRVPIVFVAYYAMACFY